MLAILAKQKGFMWSAWQGLFRRTPEGKKGDFLSDDLDQIAVLLFGKGATAKNLGSVEAILRSLPAEQAQALLAKAEDDPNWYPKKQEKVKEGPQHWFREIVNKLEESNADPKQMGSKMKANGLPNLTPVKAPPMPAGQLGPGERLEPKQDGTTVYAGGFGSFIYDKAGKPLKYVSPVISGLSQTNDLVTGNITVRYMAGPLNVTANFDKTGKPLDSMEAQYNLGLGVLSLSKDKGITTKSWKPVEPSEEDPITQKFMYATGNKDKEATYDRAMRQVQQDPAEKAALEAMLTIARLR